MSAAMEALWRVEDVAAFLSMSKSWVYKEAEMGRLPFVRIGASLRFFPEEVRGYLERQRPRHLLTLRR